MTDYHNENNPQAAAWLRNLIKRGILPHGHVDERSIADVRPGDLRGYRHVHLFSGIGGWALAAQLAGWPDDRELWTGSCPCQPFSVAGNGLGENDPRHLWPHFFRLIRACRPAVVMGEQVARKAGFGWFDGVRSDLESIRYASRAIDIPACAIDAPHIRSRLWWCGVADTQGFGCGTGLCEAGSVIDRAFASNGDGHGALVHPKSIGRREGQSEPELRSRRPAAGRPDASSGLDNAYGAGWEGGTTHCRDDGDEQSAAQRADVSHRPNGASIALGNAEYGRCEGGVRNGVGQVQLAHQIVQTARSGQVLIGSSVTTAKRGVPNPAFPCWLMGFPAEWLCGAGSETPFRQSSARKSSKRSLNATPDMSEFW